MPKTLVTGATGFIGSAVARALGGRGDELRLVVREGAVTDGLEGLDYEPVKCDLGDRRSLRRALIGVGHVFHCAGLVSLRPSDEQRVFEVNARGTRTLLEECLSAGVERVVYTSSVAAIGPAPAHGTADERQLFTAGGLGIPYVNSKHEAEVEALRLAAHGLPLVCVNPAYVFGRGDVYARSTRLVRRFMLGRIPVYAAGALNVVDVEDVARGHLLADERGERGRALHPRQPQLHLRPAVRRPRAAISGVEPPPLQLSPPRRAAAGAGVVPRTTRPRAGQRVQEVRSGEPVVDLQQHEGEARAGLDHLAARGHDRGDRAVVPRARGRPHRARAALAAVPVQAGGARRCRTVGARPAIVSRFRPI